MTGNLIHIRERLFNRPLFLHPEKAIHLVSVFQQRGVGVSDLVIPGEGAAQVRLGETAMRDLTVAAARGVSLRAARAGLVHTMGNIGIIQVHGSLVGKSGNVDPASGLTGYDGLRWKLDAAASDDSIKGILLDLDSGGGEATESLGALAAEIRRVSSEVKPVWATCSDYAYSAAYYLASAAERIFVPSLGGVGSIGAVIMHADFSDKLAKDGVRVTLIHAGVHKVDGNPFEALPDAVRDDLQERVDLARREFAVSVANHRNMSVDAVLETEARCFTAAGAVEAGLADEVLGQEEVLAAFQEHLSSAGTGGSVRQIQPPGSDPADREEESTVSDTKQAPATETGTGTGAVTATVDTETIQAEAAKAAKDRINAILNCEEAKGREALANHFAFSTDMSADAAASALAAAPKEQAGKGLYDAMASEQNPDLGTGESSSGDENPLIAAGRLAGVIPAATATN